MKLLTPEVKPDPKRLFREIAQAALDGGKQAPPLAAPVELYDASAGAESPSKGDIDKYVSQLRSGLASVDMGRFTVEPIGNKAWVSVNAKPMRTRTKKADKKPATPPVAKKSAPAAK